jgi:hypothetical protein
MVKYLATYPRMRTNNVCITLRMQTVQKRVYTDFQNFWQRQRIITDNTETSLRYIIQYN